MRPHCAPETEFDPGKLNGSNKEQTVALELEPESSESDEDRDSIYDDQEAVPLEVQVAEFRKMMHDVMELFEDQVAKGNEKFAVRRKGRWPLARGKSSTGFVSNQSSLSLLKSHTLYQSAELKLQWRTSYNGCSFHVRT